MMILNGNNLGERHREFNSKVSEAVAKQSKLEELKSQPEECDVDKLFKIGLASKYKDIDYILDVLKCGDVFHITHALKCLWLYTDEYSQFINTDYLDNNVFPYMSMKMKRKMLTTISIHMRDADRAVQFYKYCTNCRLKDHAAKFVLFTPDSFKLHLLKMKNFNDIRDPKYLQQFIGRSFELALAYLTVCGSSTGVVLQLRFLYSVSDEEYLNLLERYISVDARYPHSTIRLGLRISKDILINHKQRVLNKPLLYINILSKSKLVKYLTTEDVELLAPGLLPRSLEGYWALDFCNAYKFLLEKIPMTKLFSYMKQIYTSKYNDCTFEMRIEFYKLKYYEMLNIDEREAWALQHIERDEELPGIKNYIWYKFVSFPKAFAGIKRYIFLTPDKDERSQIVNILPETARNQEDIREILRYYYERHVNESEEHKEGFINKVIEFQDIYSFNNECWTFVDKLFYSLDVYTTGSYVRGEYKFRSLIYHILHGKELPEGLMEYIGCLSQFYHLESLIEQLSEERKAIAAKYLLDYFAEKVKSLMDHPDYDKVKEDDDYWGSGSIKSQIQDIICTVWSIIHSFKRSNDDCPDIVNKFMESNMDIYQYHERYKPKFEKRSEEDFVRWLKQDIEMAVDAISEIRCNTYRWNFKLCRLFRKLKVYFPTDVGREYLDYFTEYLSDVPKGYREYRNIKMAVVGVFYLADTECIISLLEKNVPTSPKIDHMNIDNRVLQVQKAICRLAYHTRPPLPLSNFQKYITGDYVHYCLPIFYNYFANLPSNQKFIERLLDAPLSIQKHGLRLAFKAYDAEILKPIIVDAWKRTKNVSLRMILYETLFDRIINDNEEVQKKLYEVLKLYTSELNHDDHENVYALLVSDDLPDVFKGDFIQTAWLTVSQLPDKSVDIKRRISIIRHMEKYIHLVQRDFPHLQIIDDHINDMLFEKNINKDCGEYYFKELISAKWHLTAKYIVSFNTEVEKQRSIQLMQTIMSKSLESWNLVKYKTYTLRKFMQKFIKTIMEKDPKTIETCENMVSIYVCIRDNIISCLKERKRRKVTRLKKEEIYLLNWELKLSIMCRNIIHDGRKDSTSKSDQSTYMSNKDITDAYAKKVTEMLVTCVKNDEFYRCFYQSIADTVKTVGCTMCDILGTGSTGLVYYVCDRLIEVKMTETHILALFMLPRDPPWNWESEHSDTISKIRKQSVSQEVRSFLYEKYVLSDWEVRSYVT